MMVPLLLPLGGCFGIVGEGMRASKNTGERDKYLAAAERGDAVAQFKVGDSYCCSPTISDPIYDNRKATRWLCASARQNHAPAMLKLSRIYSGKMVDGLRLAWRTVDGVSNVFASTRENLSVAYSWANLAKQHGEADAAKLSQAIWEDMNKEERGKASELLKLGLDIPCEWDAVLTHTTK